MVHLMRIPKTQPKRAFLILLAATYTVLTVADVIHQTLSGPNLLDVGNLFLAQCLAFFIVTAWVLAVPEWRKRSLPWVAASLGSLALIIASYAIFYGYHRIVTEADGPASVGYVCMLGEQYDTISSLAGEASDDHSVTAKLCVLKNMPIAASNVLFIWNDPELSGFVLFLIGDGLLFGVMTVAKRLPRYIQ
jgi:hypothetical protein